MKTKLEQTMNETQIDAINDCIEAGIAGLTVYCANANDITLAQCVEFIRSPNTNAFIGFLNELHDDNARRLAEHLRALATGQDFNLIRADGRIVGYENYQRIPFNLHHLGPITSDDIRNYFNEAIDNTGILNLPEAEAMAQVININTASAHRAPATDETEDWSTYIWIAGLGIQLAVAALVAPEISASFAAMFTQRMANILAHAATGAVSGAAGGATRSTLTSLAKGEDFKPAAERFAGTVLGDAATSAAIGLAFGVVSEGIKAYKQPDTNDDKKPVNSKKSESDKSYAEDGPKLSGSGGEQSAQPTSDSTKAEVEAKPKSEDVKPVKPSLDKDKILIEKPRADDGAFKLSKNETAKSIIDSNAMKDSEPSSYQLNTKWGSTTIKAPITDNFALPKDYSNIKGGDFGLHKEFGMPKSFEPLDLSMKPVDFGIKTGPVISDAAIAGSRTVASTAAISEAPVPALAKLESSFDIPLKASISVPVTHTGADSISATVINSKTLIGSTASLLVPASSAVTTYTSALATKACNQKESSEANMTGEQRISQFRTKLNSYKAIYLTKQQHRLAIRERLEVQKQSHLSSTALRSAIEASHSEPTADIHP
jgi:hypothetical protein